MNIEWIHKPVSIISHDYVVAARQQQNNLTKPQGSLGVLEDIAVRLSSMFSCARPAVDRVHIVVFAADHGIAEEGVSAFPQAVTVEMVRNFSRGGAAISVLAKALKADLEVVNVGTVSEPEVLQGVINQRIAAGTQNFSKQPAMSPGQLAEALNAGRDAVMRAKKSSAQLFIGGDMGIANTSSATAIACALLNEKPEVLAGPGTGLDKSGIAHKVTVIQRALDLHKPNMHTPTDVLQHVGGFEIAALTGAYLACAQSGLPAVVDGFISSAAALAAIKINPQVKDWLFFAHASAEPGHKIMMQSMQVKPLVDMNMRLGEGSGAAVVVPLMRLACALHSGMATFNQAQVSGKL
jgi:nicotinate-nucleotide--dimethylbenzimidazole phosphoribosyltransferase